MASKRDAIAAALVTALGVASVGSTNKPSGLTVARQKIRPTEGAAGLPVQNVWWAGDLPPEQEASGQVVRTSRFMIETRAKQSGSSPDAALDPFYVWAVKAILVDYTLGGLVSDIAEGAIEADFEEMADGLCGSTHEFLVKHRTAYNDPEIVG